MSSKRSQVGTGGGGAMNIFRCSKSHTMPKGHFWSLQRDKHEPECFRAVCQSRGSCSVSEDKSPEENRNGGLGGVGAFQKAKPPKIIRMARSGALPAHPLGTGRRRQWRFKLSELDKHM